MYGGFLFENEVYCLSCNAFNTAIVASTRYPASVSFIDMEPYDHAVFLIINGTLTTAASYQVYQDTSATETASIKVITGAVVTNLATDDDKWMTVEFNANQLDRTNGFRYVTIVPSAGTGGDDYASIIFLGFKAKKQPVTQSANYAYHVSVV